MNKNTQQLQQTSNNISSTNVLNSMSSNSLLESLNDIVCRTNLKGEITYINKIASHKFQQPTENLIGKNVLELLPKDKRKSTFIKFARHFLNRSCINAQELQVELFDNSDLWLGINLQFGSSKCVTCDNKKELLALQSKNITASDNCNYDEIIIIAHDITERIKTRNRIEKSEKRYQDLAESLPEMICEFSLQGQITYLNQFSLNKMGYPKEEVFSSNFSVFSVIDSQFHNRIQKNMERIIKEQKNISSEYIAIKKDGEKFPVMVYSSPIIDHNEVVGLRAVMIDITELKRSEQQIDENLTKQRIVSNVSLSFNSFENFDSKINEAIKTIGEHTQVNRVYIFKDSPDGSTTSCTHSWYNKGNTPQHEQLKDIPYDSISSWKEMLENYGMVFCENIGELPEDIQGKFEAQGIKAVLAFPLRVSGKYFGFIRLDDCDEFRCWTSSEIELLCTIANIISNAQLRNNVQADLEKRELENRVIIESIPDQIIRINRDGLILPYQSTHEHDFLGLSGDSEELNINTQLEKELSDAFNKAIKDCLDKGTSEITYSRLVWEDLFYYEARFVKLNEEEVLVVIRDTTAIKENEKQLQLAKNKAEEASKAKSEFLANVSHEIRTPMNAILGFSEWLYDSVTEEQHKNYLHVIMSSGRNLLALINDILDLSKIESGKMNIELEPMRCRIVTQEIKQVLRQKYEAKNLSFQVNIDESVPEYVYMDEVRFYQILFNLANNAIKFTPKGYISISAYTTITEDEELRDLVVSVEDSGIGIKEDQKEKVFAAFTQQSGQSNRFYEGTGLGLAIVSGLLQKLNGSIKLSSKVGKGSTFTVTFKDVRVAEVSGSGEGSAEDKNIIFDPCNILIVDDIDFNRDVLKQIINSKNVIFHEASSGEQALDLMQNIEPDLVFMDIRMSGLSGFDVTEIIKNNDQQKNIPIVAFTASTMQEDIPVIEELFDAFLQKPVSKKEVYEVLKRFLKYTSQDDSEFEEAVIIEEEQEDLVSDECKDQFLPDMIPLLEKNFMDHWSSIKDDLIIFDIEEFSNQLTEFTFGKSCNLLDQYCRDLNQGIQSFDIEKIEAKLIQFPETVEILKTYL